MTMNRPPAFQFYPNDWLSSPKITLMTPAEEGAYIRLLCYDWMNDGLPDNDEQLAALSRLGEGWFKGGGTRLRECFPLRDGKLHNPRLDEERQKQEIWRRKSQEGGKASAKARFGPKTPTQTNDKGGSGVVEPEANSSSSSPYRLSSPNSEEFRLSKLLFDLIRRRKPDFKEPDLHKWAKTMDRLLRLDRRDPARIEAVIRWCQQDAFWQSNILSPAKLREKFDQLEMKMQWQAGQGKAQVDSVIPVVRDADGLTPRERLLRQGA